MAVRDANGTVEIVPATPREGTRGRVHHAAGRPDLSSRATPTRCASRPIPYHAGRFCLSRTRIAIYATHTFARLVGTEDRRADDLAIVIAAVLDLQLTGGQGLLLAALHAEDAVRQRRRPQARIAGPRRRRRGRHRSTGVEFVGEQVDVIFEVNKDMRSRDHRPSRRRTLGSVSLLGESAVDITPSTDGHADSRLGLRPAGHAARRRSPT